MAGIIAWREYLVKLCRAIIMYGALKHQLEEYMSMFSRALEIEAWTLLTTGLVWRKQHGGLNLDTVLDRRPKFQVRFLVLTYGLASACKLLGSFAFILLYSTTSSLRVTTSTPRLTKPVMSNIHVNVMNVLQLPEIVPLQYAMGRAVVETDRHAVGDVYKFTFDLEGSREHGHVLL
ncbi:hypothetical protein E4U49_006964 [Claviceps purpurea]|nr:hypothetical protein E4U49_006964 [Claviceps purpurea]